MLSQQDTFTKSPYLMRLVLTLILSCFVSFVFAQHKLMTSPEPAWVQNYEYNQTSDTVGNANGYAYLLVSLQRHLETDEYYQRYVIKVVSEQGLSLASSINESFDPSYQKLFFHTLKITRNGKTIDKLDPNKFEVIRREEDMSRAVYDKSLNAIYNLPDVRVGDIVEYSFTQKGFNPAFGKNRFGKFYFQYGMPVVKFAHRLVASADRPVVFKEFQGCTPFTKSALGNLVVYEKVVENSPAVLEDDALPTWFDPYQRIHYSDFQSWNELKAWALNLYQYDPKTKKQLQSVVEGIKAAGQTDEAKIKECIRIVQGDIRYLSFSDGIHGYKPHSPVLVYEQKYGDCKDKSFLLSFLLNEIGVESYPALVSTDNGHTLKDVLPNPWAFNHCIVQFISNDSAYWIDPTMNAQFGVLKNYFIPSYERALVINSKNNELDSIPFGYKNSRVEVLEEYSMDHFGGDVQLKVKTQYFGDEAEEMRSYFERNTKEEVNKNFVNFYSSDYSKISLVGDVTYEDNKQENIVTSNEEYLVKNFWVMDEKTGETGSVYARVLSTYLKKPETKLRTMPLKVAHPLEIYQTIKLYLPEPITSEDYTNQIESDGFIYRGSSRYNDRVVTLRYSYKTKNSFVEAERTDDHIEKVDAALNDISYVITTPKERTALAPGYWQYILFFFVLGIFFILARRQWSKNR
jgi:transglutaminase-like putative cysteine protease